MFRTVEDFLAQWKHESDATHRTLDALTDASLAQAIANDHRTLGRIAWHLTGTVKEMMERTGLTVDGPHEHDQVPGAAHEIAATYARSAASLTEAIRSGWTDETLLALDDMYGERWARGQTLTVLITHQAHHRGQMTVLMRQAGLRPVSIYGPVMEDWAQYKMQPPAV